MSQPFNDIFQPSLGDDYYYRVADYSPATLHGEHRHEDVEYGVQKYTDSWELIETDDGRGRGSDQLYLVNDEHYVLCSRTGLETSGNAVHFSEGTPEALRFAVLTTIFERVTTRKFPRENSETGDTTSRSITTPDGNTITVELDAGDLSPHSAAKTDLTHELLTRYETVTELSDLQELVDWYQSERKELFNKYVRDDDPTVLSEVVTDISLSDKWAGPTEVSPYSRFELLMYRGEDGIDTVDDLVETVIIVVDEDRSTARLIHEEGWDDTILEEREYETEDELRDALDDLMAVDVHEHLS